MHFLDTFLGVIAQFMSDYSTMFQPEGKILFKAISVMILVWFGVTTAMNSSEYMGGFRWGAFIKLLLLIATCKYLIYSYPDFLTHISGFSSAMAVKIQANVDTDFFSHLVKIIDGIEKPGFANILLSIIYALMYCLFAVLKAIVWFIIGFGFLAQGVIAVLGPLFIPFIMVPKLDFLFWGWFKSLLQYSFYPIIANAFIYVLAHFVTAAHIYQNISTSQLLSSFAPVAAIFLIGIFSMAKVPTLVNHIFSGMSGAGSSIIPFTGGK